MKICSFRFISSHFQLLFHQMVTLEPSITWTKTTSPCNVFYISLFPFKQKANFLHLPALSPHPPTRYTLSDHCLECAREQAGMSQLLQILVALSVSQQQPPNSPFIWRHTHTNMHADCTHSTIKFVLLPVSCHLLKELMFDFCSWNQTWLDGLRLNN